MISKTSLATSLLALSLGLSACVLDGQTKEDTFRRLGV